MTFEKVNDINRKHNIYLVRSKETGNLCVQKILKVYNPLVYKALSDAKIDGIPKIIEMYEHDNNLIIFEELITGKNLKELIDSGVKLSRRNIINYMIQLATILNKLHSLKVPVIHRDIKPSNVIIDENNKVHLIDLNASKFYNKNNSKNEDTTLLGTHGFAAPEQYGFGESTPKTDIYGLGILLKTLLDNAVDNKLNEDLIRIAKICSEINPDDRYNNISEVISELKKALKKKEIKPGSLLYKIRTNKVISILIKYAPPGFRTGNIWHMLIAIAGYSLIVFLFSGMLISEGSNTLLIVYRIIFGLMGLFTVFCTFNYLDIQKVLPVCQSRKPLIRIFGIILLNFTMYALLFMVLIILVQFIK